MTKTNWKQAGRKAGGAAIVIAGVGAGVWFSLILADVLTFWYFYSSSQSVLEDYGMTEYGSKLLGLAFGVLFSLTVNGILWRIIKRDQDWIPRLAFLMAVWFGVMYVMASPYANSSFNPFSGQPGKYYRDQFNTLVKIPNGAKVGPSGEEVRAFDRASAQEYERQHGQMPMQAAGPSWWQFWRSEEQPELDMWVEKIVVTLESTEATLAVRRHDNTKSGRFYQSLADSSYLVDERGTTYEVLLDQADYNSRVDAKSHEPVGKDYSWPYALSRELRPDEVYRFNMVYKRLNSGIKHLRMYDNRFGVHQLDRQLAQARWVVPLPPPPPPPPPLAPEPPPVETASTEHHEEKVVMEPPAPKPRLGAYEGEPLVETIGRLSVKLESIRLLNNGEVVLGFVMWNHASEIGPLAFALKEQGAGGMMDYYKFFPPKPIVRLVDGSDRAYRYSESSGFNFAREKSDWGILKTSKEITGSLTFQGGREDRPIGPFTVDMEFFYGEVSGTKPSVSNIRFTDIRPK